MEPTKSPTAEVETAPPEIEKTEDMQEIEFTEVVMTEELNTVTSEPRNGNADVLFVRVVENPDGSWTFYVTVSHPDTGWDDYADGWNVTTPDGQVLTARPDDRFTRLLLHPHVGEQPFTRSQSGIVLPEGVRSVIVSAHDLADGFGGQEVIVDFNTDTGENYEIQRSS
ncbi:MAG: hypothetical protein OEV06_12675 [Anaerolineae bacterium]|nr:hypothetical protein [Anaerolineae bacterium]